MWCDRSHHVFLWSSTGYKWSCHLLISAVNGVPVIPRGLVPLEWETGKWRRKLSSEAGADGTAEPPSAKPRASCSAWILMPMVTSVAWDQASYHGPSKCPLRCSIQSAFSFLSGWMNHYREGYHQNFSRAGTRQSKEALTFKFMCVSWTELWSPKIHVLSL